MQKFAGFLAEKIIKKEERGLLVIALEGNLGAGKTTFAKGFIKGLGVRKRIMSPTFVLMKKYEIKGRGKRNYKRVYHIDCYRVKNSRELLSLGLKEILNNPENIVLVEWPEKIKKYLPKNIIQVRFNYGKKENERMIIISKFKNQS